MNVTSKEFRDFLEECVKSGKMTQNQSLDLQYTCAELSLRPDPTALQKFIAKVENDIDDNNKLTIEIR